VQATPQRRTPISVDTPASDRELALTRLIDAPREKLFRAWTEPEVVRHVAIDTQTAESAIGESLTRRRRERDSNLWSVSRILGRSRPESRKVIDTPLA